MESFDEDLICNILEEEYYDGNSCGGPSSVQHHHSSTDSFPIEFVEMESDKGIQSHVDEKQEFESMTVDEIVYSHMNGMSDSSLFAGVPTQQEEQQQQEQQQQTRNDELMEPITVDSSSKSHRRGGEMSRSDGELMIDFDDSPLPFVEEDQQQQQQQQHQTMTPTRQHQRQQVRDRRPPMEKSNSWSSGCCAYSVSPSTTTYTTASTSSSHSTIGTGASYSNSHSHSHSTSTPPIIRKSSAPGTPNVSISPFAGDALSRVSSPNPDRYMRLLSAKQKKDKILMMTRVLLGLLQKQDEHFYTQAMAAMEECKYRHKNKEKGYESLTMSTQQRLRQMVGEDYWNRARMLLRVKVERENSSNGGNKNTYMSYFKRLTMTEMANLLAAYGMSRSDIVNMQRYDRVATLCHLSSPQQQA